MDDRPSPELLGRGAIRFRSIASRTTIPTTASGGRCRWMGFVACRGGPPPPGPRCAGGRRSYRVIGNRGNSKVRLRGLPAASLAAFLAETRRTGRATSPGTGEVVGSQAHRWGRDPAEAHEIRSSNRTVVVPSPMGCMGEGGRGLRAPRGPAGPIEAHLIFQSDKQFPPPELGEGERAVARNEHRGRAGERAHRRRSAPKPFVRLPIPIDVSLPDPDRPRLLRRSLSRLPHAPPPPQSNARSTTGCGPARGDTLPKVARA